MPVSRRIIFGAILAAVLSAHAAAAQDYPSKPVRVVVPFPPGGGTDLYARELSQALAQRLGQPFVVENKPGASAAIGTELVAKAAPDGYTILVTSNSLVTAPALNRKLRFDPVKDLAPVTLGADQPIALAVAPAVKGGSLGEVLADIKANPGKYNYVTAGVGSPQHLTTEHLRSLTGIDAVHVPLQGQGPMITELISGRSQIGFLVFSSAKPYFDNGQLRSVGIAGPKRTDVAPGQATLAEGGIKDFAVQWWLGVLAPAGTPEPIVQKLNREIVAIGSEPAFRSKLAAAGIDVIGSTPAEFAKAIKDDLALWTSIVDKNGIEAK